jgi:hypothetical protein
MEASSITTWLTTTELATSVHRQPGREHVAIGDWTSHRLTDGAGEGLGVWRVAGQVTRDDSLQPWSLILKGSAPAEPGTSRYGQELAVARGGDVSLRSPRRPARRDQDPGVLWRN